MDRHMAVDGRVVLTGPICGSAHRNARPDILDLSGACSRPPAEARTPGHADEIMRSKGESLSAGEGARHVGPYQEIRADLPDKPWLARLRKSGKGTHMARVA